jgi:hypothetical protein
VGERARAQRHAGELDFGSDLEFLSRPEWTALRDAYGLGFRAQRSYTPTFMYRALDSHDVDVISAFSSDGRIAAQGLVVLADPLHALPSYDAVLLLAAARPGRATASRALAAHWQDFSRAYAGGQFHGRPRHRQGDAAAGRPLSRGRRRVGGAVTVISGRHFTQRR